MKFDANYLPNYLPEYNFSFIGKFMENDAMLFEVRAKGSFCYINNDCTGAGANSSATWLCVLAKWINKMYLSSVKERTNFTQNKKE